MGSEQQSTCQNNYLPPVARIGGEGENKQTTTVWLARMWKPLFFSHFPSFPLNLGQTLAVPSQQMMSSAMGWVCFHLSEQQDSEPPAWSSASLTHNRSCLPRVGEENSTAYFPVLWIFSELQKLYFLSVLFWEEPKF